MFAAFYFAFVWVVQILALLALPLLVLKVKYRHSLPARFALWRNAFPRERIDFWFHACSLGEVSSLLPLHTQMAQNSTSGNPLDVWFPANPTLLPQIADQGALSFEKHFKDGEWETSSSSSKSLSGVRSSAVSGS